MDRQRIEGGIKKTTGNIKEKAGQVIGNRHLETEGKSEKAEGRIRSGVGKAMDAVRDVVNKTLVPARYCSGEMHKLSLCIPKCTKRTNDNQTRIYEG